MINWQGIVDWEVTSIRYDQTNNTTEEIIRKIKAEMIRELKEFIPKEYWKDIDKLASYLELCGHSAFLCLMQGMRYLPAKYNNGFKLGNLYAQMEDIVASISNQRRYNSLFQSGNGMDNRYLDTYPVLAWELFGCKAEVITDLSFYDIIEYLWNGIGVQLWLREPSHYIAAISANKMESLIKYNDSWGSRVGLNNRGLHEIMDLEEYRDNVHPYAIVYHKKSA